MKSDTTCYVGLIVAYLYRKVITLIYGYHYSWGMLKSLKGSDKCKQRCSKVSGKRDMPSACSDVSQAFCRVAKLMNAMSCECAHTLMAPHPVHTGCCCVNLFCFSFYSLLEMQKEQIGKLFLFSLINLGQIWIQLLGFQIPHFAHC